MEEEKGDKPIQADLIQKVKGSIKQEIIGADPMLRVRNKINDTLEEISSLKKEIRTANHNNDKLLCKAYDGIKQVEMFLEGALGDLAGSLDEIKERLDGMDAEFFTQIFSGIVSGLKQQLAERDE